MPPWAKALFGILQAVLGDDQDREPGVGGQGGAHPGQPAADDQQIGKIVRDPLGAERDEVARGERHLGGGQSEGETK